MEELKTIITTLTERLLCAMTYLSPLHVFTHKTPYEVTNIVIYNLHMRKLRYLETKQLVHS